MADKINRLMVFVPLVPIYPRINLYSLIGIMGLDWDKPMMVMFGREDMKELPGAEDKYANLTAKCNKARSLALAGGYDALLIIESDMIVPPMAVYRMANVEADVVYALYCSRRKSHNWLIFSDVTSFPFTVKKLGGTAEDRNRIWGNVVPSQGMGLGCTLIRRNVLERIQFRCPDPQVSCDWYFAVDVKEAGFTQAHDCGVSCGHVDGDTVIWPEPDHGFWIEE